MKTFEARERKIHCRQQEQQEQEEEEEDKK